MADDAPAFPQEGITPDNAPLNPVLTKFVNAFTTPQSQAWASSGARAVQDYLHARNIVENSRAAGEAITMNVMHTRDNLVQMVRADPASTDLALGLAQHSIHGIVGNHPELDETTAPQVAGDLTGHIQSAVAHAAVSRFAEMDANTATDALGRYGKYLNDDDKSGLSSYITAQASARVADQAAQTQMSAQRTVLASGTAANSRLNMLSQADTGNVVFPPGWAAQLTGDQSILPDMKSSMLSAYGRLQAGGDQHTNPFVATDLLRRISDPSQQAGHGEIFDHVGQDLSLADARLMSSVIMPQSPASRQQTKDLADTLSDAQSTLASHENGAGGATAFSRFVDWLLPQVRQGAALPDLMAGNRLQSFAPTGNDVMEATRRMRAYDSMREQTAAGMASRSVPDSQPPGPDANNNLPPEDNAPSPQGVPGTGDIEATGSSAPWEERPGVAAPPSDQEI